MQLSNTGVHFSGAFGERTYMVRRLLGKELLFEELENRRDQDRHSVPLLDMAGRWCTEHHQSSSRIPQVIYDGKIIRLKNIKASNFAIRMFTD